jgi:hypothetical protein
LCAYGWKQLVNLVDASHTLKHGNKTRDTWFGLDNKTVTSIPGVDCAKHVDISHGFKGQPEALNLTFKSSQLFYCSKHCTDAVGLLPSSKGGGTGKMWYLKALHAPTHKKLQKIKEEMPPAVAAHLSKVHDKDQYLAAASGNNCGRTTSSYMESGNKSILPGRHLHPTAAVICLVGSQNSKPL